MKLSALVVVVAAALLAPTAALADAGAIAYSPSTGHSGYAYGWSCREEAEAAALRYCGDGDCTVVVWEQNDVAALAVGASGAPYYGWAGTRSEAERFALEACGRDTTGCAISAWVEH
jgi:hypothetical protein